MSVLHTRHGYRLDLREPCPSQIDPEDIIQALAAQCRFSGHTRVFYSVAEHSMMVAEMVPAPIRLRALLHDATEAYVADVPSPLKALLPEYRAIEARVWAAIALRFGLPIEDASADRLIRQADLMALNVEMRDLFDRHPGRVGLPKPPEGFRVPPKPLTQWEAATRFRAVLNVLARPGRALEQATCPEVAPA